MAPWRWRWHGLGAMWRSPLSSVVCAWSPAHMCSAVSGSHGWILPRLTRVERAGLCWAWVGASVNDTEHVCRTHFPRIGAAKRGLCLSSPRNALHSATLGPRVSEFLLRADTAAVRAPDVGRPWGSFSRCSCGLSCARWGATGTNDQPRAVPPPSLSTQPRACLCEAITWSLRDRQYIVLAQVPGVQFHTETVLVPQGGDMRNVI